MGVPCLPEKVLAFLDNKLILINFNSIHVKIPIKKLIPNRLEHMLANYILTLYKRMVIMFIQY